MNRRVQSILLIVGSFGASASSEDYLLLPAKVNGQAVCFAMDTGTERTCLFESAARRLGLAVTPPSPNARIVPGQVVAGRTEECSVEIGDGSTRLRFHVPPLPGYARAPFDGLIGWDILSQFVIEVSGSSRRVHIGDKLPPDLEEWRCLDIRPGARVLLVEIPSQSGGPNVVFIDTGSPIGVRLNQRRWQEWVDAHPDQPATLDAMFQPGVGVVVEEERWAHDLRIDGLLLREVPIRNGSELDRTRFGPEYAATLGGFALRRLSLVVDGTRKKVYLRNQDQYAYEYNRLGAVFVPASGDANGLIAHVAQGSPADRAGIRDGDVLLRIDELDVTHWQTDPRVLPLSRFWCRPSGTTLDLGLKRNGQTLETTAVLEGIFEK